MLLFFKLVYFADDRVEEAANESEDNSMLFAYSFMSFVGHMFVELCLDLFEIYFLCNCAILVSVTPALHIKYCCVDDLPCCVFVTKLSY